MNKIIFLTLFTVIITSLNYSQDFDLLADRVMSKNIKGIEEMLNNEVDINTKEKSTGSTVLMLASSYSGYEDIIEYLISKGADVNTQANDGKTALMWAASNSAENVKILISKGANVNMKANDGMNAFIQSVFGVLSKKVPIETCDIIRENGADINTSLTSRDASGWTALHYAVMNGETDLVKYLIRYGANVNKATSEGSTPIYLAKQEGYEEIVKILKKAGAQE